MHFAVSMFPTDRAIPPAELAVAVEERGFESLWFPEHSHIPTSRTSPWPGGPELPDMYRRTLDQYVALTAAATVTSRIGLGSGVTLVAQRDPIWLAKQVASVDHLSGGRMLFGIGYGWNREEMEHHGVDYRSRRDLVREKVLAMKALWTADEASFRGEHVSFAPSWSWPKPVQRPHPPVIIGGGPGPRLYAAVAEYGDGWMPIAGRNPIEDHIARLRRAVADAGRDPDQVSVGVFSAPLDPARLEALAATGVERAVFGLPAEPAGVVLAALDRLAAFVAAL